MSRKEIPKSVIKRDKVNTILKYKNLTQKKLALGINVSYDHLKQCLRKETITKENLEAIAEFLDITPDYLTGKQTSIFDGMESVQIEELLKNKGSKRNRSKEIRSLLSIKYEFTYKYYQEKNCINKLIATITGYVNECHPVFTDEEYNEISCDIEKIIIEKCKSKGI